MFIKALKKILPLLIKIGLYLTLFTPFIVSSRTLFPFIFGKAITFQIIIEIIFFFYLVLILIDKKFFFLTVNKNFFSANLLFGAITAYIAVLFLTTLTSQDIFLSFWGTQERMTGLFTILHFFAYFLILAGVLKTQKDWLNLLRVNVLVIFILGIYALIKTKFLTATAARFEASFGNPDIIGSYLLLAFFLIIVLWVIENRRSNKNSESEGRNVESLHATTLQTLQTKKYHQTNKYFFISYSKIKKIIWKIFYAFSLFLAILGLILCQTRAAYVGIFAGFLVFFFLYLLFSPHKQQKDDTRKRSGLTYYLIGGLNFKYCFKIMSVLILFLLGGGFLFLGISGRLPAKITQLPFVNRILSIPLSLENTNSDTRIMSWQAGIEGFKEKPIFGWGLENYSLVFNRYIKADFFASYYYANLMQFDKAHNKFFEVLTENGILGIISYLAVFIVAIILLLKKKNNLNFLLISLLLAYFVQNLFSFDTPVSYLLFFLTLGFIVFLFAEGDDNHRRLQEEGLRQFWLSGWQFIVLILIILIIPCLSYFGTIKPFLASRQAVIARAAFLDPKTENLSLFYYQQAVNYNTFVNREASYHLCREFIIKAAKPNFKLTDYFKEYALLCVKNIEPQVNKKIFHYEETLLIGKLYSILSHLEPNYLDRAEAILQQAILYAPLRAQVYSDLGLILLQKKNYPDALLNFNKALELKGNESYNYWQIALVYLGEGKFQSALEFIEKAKTAGYNYENLSDYATIGFVYSNLANWEQALMYYQNALVLDSRNIEILGSITLVYKEKGDKSAARLTAEKILEIAPGAKEDVEKFLKEL